MLERLGINPGQLLMQIFNFLILFAIFYGVWKKLLSGLDARRATIIKTHEDATSAQEILAKADNDAKLILAEAEKQAHEILAKTQVQAEQIIKENETQAKHRAEQILVEAEKQGDILLEGVLLKAKHHMENVATNIARKIIGETLIDPVQAHTVIADFFTRMPSEVQDLGPEIEITSALPLNEREKEDIHTRFPPPNHVIFKIDPTVLGGILITSGRTIINGSVQKQLENIKATL